MFEHKLRQKLQLVSLNCCASSVYMLYMFCKTDCRRGQSLVVHAINEGRQCARQIDLDLMGHTSLASVGGVVTSTRTAEGLLDQLWSRPPMVNYDTDNYSDAGSLA